MISFEQCLLPALFDGRKMCQLNVCLLVLVVQRMRLDGLLCFNSSAVGSFCSVVLAVMQMVHFALDFHLQVLQCS